MTNGYQIYVGNKSVEILPDNLEHGVDMNVAQYPVEKGSPIVDNAIMENNQVDVSGVIVAKDWKNADNLARQLYNWQIGKTIVNMRNGINDTNYLIQNWKKTLDDPMNNAVKISMTLVRIRIATSSYTKRKNSGKKQASHSVKKRAYHSSAVYLTVKRGNTYWAWSMRYGTSIPQLRAWNRYPDRFIPIGVRVRVK